MNICQRHPGDFMLYMEGPSAITLYDDFCTHNCLSFPESGAFGLKDWLWVCLWQTLYRGNT